MSLDEIRVLWVDDEIEEIGPEVTRLALEGCKVSCACSGEQALVAAKSGPFSLLILDLRLPDCDGLELLRQMRAEGFSAPVIVLTAYAYVDAAWEAGRLGVSAFLEKPWDADDMVARLRMWQSARLREAVTGLVSQGDPLATPLLRRSTASKIELLVSLATILLDDKTDLFRFISYASAFRAVERCAENGRQLTD